MKAKPLILILTVFAFEVQAGVIELTYHSRANCVGFNESISWHLGHSNLLKTYSDHIYNPTSSAHEVVDNWRATWRSAAYHATESYKRDQYTVIGLHWMEVAGTRKRITVTVVKDCSIYDGWWDH